MDRRLALERLAFAAPALDVCGRNICAAERRLQAPGERARQGMRLRAGAGELYLCRGIDA